MFFIYILTLILPMLSAIRSLDTTVFKNLRLVLEYDTKNAVVTTEGLNATPISSVVQPLLVVDELENMVAVQQMRKNVKNISWYCYENEKVRVPIHPETQVTQQLSFKLSGLASNKNLGRIFIQKSSTDYATTQNFLFLSNGSLAMWNEKVNVLLANLLVQNFFHNWSRLVYVIHNVIKTIFISPAPQSFP